MSSDDYVWALKTRVEVLEALLREALSFADTVYEHRGALRVGPRWEMGCILVDRAIVLQERIKLAMIDIDAALGEPD